MHREQRTSRGREDDRQAARVGDELAKVVRRQGLAVAGRIDDEQQLLLPLLLEFGEPSGARCGILDRGLAH